MTATAGPAQDPEMAWLKAFVKSLPVDVRRAFTLRKVYGLTYPQIAAHSNQYAAMPSLHTSWAAWCALVLIPIIHPTWGRYRREVGAKNITSTAGRSKRR